ncbi:MAG: DUF4143 domain-containing protein, partial [Candidatus Dadabacteria bacterium]
LKELEATNFLGAVYESWIFSEIVKASDYESLSLDITTWRTEDGSEIDLILSKGIINVPIEIKFKREITKRDVAALKSWLKTYDDTSPGAYAIYPGEDIKQLDKKIWALPDWLVLATG